MATTNTPPDLLRGTVDLLILRTVANGPLHGYAISQRLRVVSGDVLQVGESSLYPSLQRLLLKGWVDAEWGTSGTNRKARFYSLTRDGREQLAAEAGEFNKLVAAIQLVLKTA
jgi:transcriptional regulator